MDAFNTWVKAIQPIVTSTRQEGSNGKLGDFGGVFDLQKMQFEDPLLIAANDGVGTKIAVAISMKHHDNIGIDLVAMSVNDVVAQGGQPLFFLDYLASTRLNTEVATKVITSIAEGCKQAKCVLIGGETAEMPDMHREGEEEYELAGFAVGACERSDLLPHKKDIKTDDILFGLASSGFHANGFSLLRHILKEHGLDYDSAFPLDESKSIGEILLRATRIYVDSIVNAMKETSAIKALAHITGGGFIDNIPRALPSELSVEINLGSWEMPIEMQWFQNLGKWEDVEMVRTFNCGIGMVGITSPENKEKLFSILQEKGETVYEIGRVVENKKEKERVHLLGKLEALK